VGLERGPLSLVSIAEELLERKNSGSGLENRDYWPGERGGGRCADQATPSIRKKLALTNTCLQHYPCKPLLCRTGRTEENGEAYSG
jgi:hypothetical protein